MIDQQEDEEVFSLLKPIFDDEDTTAKTIRKGSHEMTVSSNNKYKTEKCRYWAIYQNCPFGQSCAFAHGEEEMRFKLHTSNNYRTKLCMNFSRTGVCKYGQRCQFKHQVREMAFKILKPTNHYEQLLDSLPETLGEVAPVRRLRLFSDFEEDDFEKINWKFKKTRMYSI